MTDGRTEAGGPHAKGTGCELALLLDGGGARAAYQAGFLRALGRRLPDLEVNVLVGVSAGAINAAWLASRPGNFGERTEGLAQLWAGLSTGEVIDVRLHRLAWRALRWLLRLGTGGRTEDPRGLLDNTPLRGFLARALESPDGTLPGIARNIAEGPLRAVAITATAYTTGQSVTFSQGRELELWERPQRRSQQVALGLDHVLASAALPFLFPAQGIDGRWYGDGGIRLTAPLSPAVHLGAERILAVSTRYGRSDGEADLPATLDYPPPAQVVGVLLNAIFLDALDGDALRLERINRLLEDRPRGDLRPIDLWVARPSADIGRRASDFEHLVPRGLRFLERGTGTQETRSNDLLSLILFEGEYLRELLAIGERDAERELEPLAHYLTCGPRRSGLGSAGQAP